MRLAPRHWPISTRIALSLAAAALAPIGVAGVLGAQRARTALEATSLDNLQLLARVTAARLDQLVHDTQAVVRALRDEPEVRALCSDPRDARRRVAVRHRLARIVAADPHLASAFVTDARGRGLVSTNPRNEGQDLTFREYWRAARRGEFFVSSILVGKTSGEAGVYFSAPVTDNETCVGVAVLKLHGEAVRGIVGQVRIGADGFAVLTDEHGVVLAHPDQSALYQSIVPLDDATVRAIEPEIRWGRGTIPSLGLFDPAWLRESHGTATTGTFVFPGTDVRWTFGSAPMARPAWQVTTMEPSAQFTAGIDAVLAEQLWTVVLIALAAAALAVAQSRSIVRPIRALTETVDRIAAGDLDARARIEARDEVGRLAAAVNDMVPELRAGTAMRHALALANQVQQSLLPAGAPAAPGLEVAGRNLPCDEIGGTTTTSSTSARGATTGWSSPSGTSSDTASPRRC